jgi:hypothetical protein
VAKPCEAIRLLSWISDLAHIFSGSALSGSQNSDLNQGIRDRFTGGRRIVSVESRCYRVTCDRFTAPLVSPAISRLSCLRWLRQNSN